MLSYRRFETDWIVFGKNWYLLSSWFVLVLEIIFGKRPSIAAKFWDCIIFRRRKTSNFVWWWCKKKASSSSIATHKEIGKTKIRKFENSKLLFLLCEFRQRFSKRQKKTQLHKSIAYQLFIVRYYYITQKGNRFDPLCYLWRYFFNSNTTENTTHFGNVFKIQNRRFV